MYSDDQIATARVVRAHPVVILVFVYAVQFLVCAMLRDVWSDKEAPNSYFFAAGLAVPFWIGLRSWSKRVLAASGSDAKPQ